MTPDQGIDRTEKDQGRSCTLVWIDAREAVIVRWQDGRTRIERVESEVPAHRGATGHVRHDPGIRHGGGGGSQTAGEPHRLEHLKRFVVDIAARLAPGDDLLILGSGTVHEHLARWLAEGDEHRKGRREIVCEASPPATDRQLIARLRRFAGVEPRRRTVGAYRWSEPLAPGRSGRAELRPRRVTDKPAHARARSEHKD
jgi:hypothetical protein